ncbi:TonB-dependent receptor [Sphingomonas sp. BIUV-7]|uniref:TonB-dependent receptor n=1 Tax=Sphingomonas natans TaxID=3063330 RepID=A0ABT8Y7I4_9SPHN|nr:TonB-dependent receptor [Sphingomonas sp. BIUV-7]MDO6414272.1 TonB-dependent receptor [Sphingomonas sp. BIUV-7]
MKGFGMNGLRAGLLSASAALALLPTMASAQTTAAPPAEAPTPTAIASAAEAAPDIIVTGTTRARIALDTPLAVTSLNSETLARRSASNQADILNSIPTIKADGGGGEVAANVFVKGLPSGGQYQFTPLMYDGIPVFSTFGLNSSAFDVYYRNDLGIDRLEFVRGGVSNLFGPGSVAGLINYLSRSGTDTFRGTTQLEYAQRGRYRGDLAVSGPLAENLFYAFSGFYRDDEGPIRTDLDTKGYQLRANLKYAFPDNGGSVTLYGQWIDDQVQYYLPIPLDGVTRNRIPGNDGKKVNSVQNKFPLASLGFNTPDGPFVSDIDDGVYTKGGQVALAFDKKMSDNWGFNGRAKYSQYKHKFGLWSDGDGIVNVPETLASFVTNAARRAQIPELNGISLANATYTFAGGGAVPANTLLFANRFTDRNRPMHDFTGELNLTGRFVTGALDHSVTLGGFYANAWARDVNVTSTYLAEFNNQPRLINLTVTNPTTGATTIISHNGLTNASTANYVNNRHKAERYAAYLADQIEIGDRFNLDLGGRVEHFSGDVRRERVSTFITDTTTPNLSAALRDVSWGNDGYLTGKVSATEWAAAFGLLYKLTDRVSLYANGSRGYFFPEIRAVGFAPLPTGTAANASASPGTSSYSGEIIKQAEAGIKVAQPQFTFTAAALYTKLNNRRQVLFINAPGGGFQEAVNLIATESYGVEATLDIKLLRSLHFNGNMTLQHAEYTQFQALVNNVPTPNPAIIGNQLERQPNLLYNAGLYYDDGALDVSFFTNYTGENYVASNNAILLKGWNIVNLDAGYKIPLGSEHALRFSVNVFNLFDTDAVTEGSPRLDNNQTVGGQYFVGRPVLPRRVTGRLTFTF